MIDSPLLKRAGLSVAALVLLPGLHCILAYCDSDTCEPELQLAETEPNGELATAQVIQLDGAECILVTGRIDDEDDIDLFEIGPASAGDRITVDVTSAQTDLDAMAVLFSTDPDQTLRDLVATNDDELGATGSIDPFIDTIVRHDIDHCLLGVSASFGTLLPSGDYEATIRVQRGGSVPQPSPQMILLDFDGGTITTRAGQVVAVTAFDPTSLGASYAGQDQAIRELIAATVRENFAPFSVLVRTTDDPASPAPGPFSSVFIGQVEGADTLIGSEPLGFAPGGVDVANADPGDQAVVFVNSFVPETFGLLDPLTPEQLGVALGNVATHEAGHLLGLNHAFDPSSIMNTFGSAGDLLLDQRFKRSLVDFAIFDPLGNALTQDAPRLLMDTVGGVVRIADAAYPVSDTPLALAAIDADNDGNLDLAVANRYGDGLSILRNGGGGLFTSSAELALGAGPIDVVALDADGDGDRDLVTANPATQTLSVLLSNGGAGFALAEVALNVTPTSLAAADLDSDGDVDLAATLASNQVAVLLNDGAGGFGSGATAYPVGEAPVSVAAADLDADGLPDLVAANSEANTVSLLSNLGDATFSAHIDIIAGAFPGVVTPADLDADGDLDLAVADLLTSLFEAQFISNVTVLSNNGDGTFSSPVAYFVGAGAQGLAAADLDGDGDMDLAAACAGNLFAPPIESQVSVLLNRGDGTFSQDVAYRVGQGPRRIIAVNLSGEALPDLAVVNADSNDVSILLNHGDGTFGTAVDVPEP